MMTPLHPQLAATLRLLSRVTCVCVILISSLVLATGIFDALFTERSIPGDATMKASAALAFVLSGTTLWMIWRENITMWARSTAYGGAALIILIGLLTLGEYASGLDLSVERLFVNNPVYTTATDTMAPTTALSFLLIGAALLLLGKGGSYRLVQALILAALWIAVLAVVIYGYGIVPLYRVVPDNPIALLKTAMFIMLCFSILFAYPERGLIALAVSDSTTGVIVRRLLPVAISIPLLVSWVRLLGEHASFYGAEFGAALSALANITVFTLFIWWIAKPLSQMEQALRESEQRFRATFEQAAVGIAHIALDRQWLQVNRRFCDIVGYEYEELIRRTFRDLIHPDDLPIDQAHFQQIINGQMQTYSIEKRYIRKDGSSVWVNQTRSLVRDAAGAPQYFISVIEDISARKQAEQNLRTNEARLAGIIASAMDAIITIDAEKRITLFNRAAEQMFDCSTTEALGAPLDRFVPPQFRAKHARSIDAFSVTGISNRVMGHLGNVSGLRTDGSVFPIEASISQIEADGQKFYTALLRDITDRIKAEESLRQYRDELELRVRERTCELEAANRELEAFSYSVSHDLRAPLRAMDGFSRILLEEYAPQLPKEAHDYLQLVRNNAQQMGQLVDDLLAFSRLSRQALKKQPVDPANLVQQVLEDVSIEHNGRHVDVVIRDLPSCQADPALLKQVYTNLIANAFKFTRCCGQAIIEIGAQTNGGMSDETTYFVKDNGVGFNPRYAGKLFGVFQRLHRAEEYEGTGVGLAIVQRIVHRHGGQIWATAEVNQGATFFFTLGGGNGS
jgi:PAS domain S-box-containing protein